MCRKSTSLRENRKLTPLCGAPLICTKAWQSLKTGNQLLRKPISREPVVKSLAIPKTVTLVSHFFPLGTTNGADAGELSLRCELNSLPAKLNLRVMETGWTWGLTSESHRNRVKCCPYCVAWTWRCFCNLSLSFWACQLLCTSELWRYWEIYNNISGSNAFEYMQPYLFTQRYRIILLLVWSGFWVRIQVGLELKILLSKPLKCWVKCVPPRLE